MLLSGTLFAQWQVNYTVAQIPQKMYAYSADTAFIVGNTNTLYRTNDKGTTWASVTVPSSTGNLMDIAFLNKTDGFIANASGLIYYSSDKGTTWESLAHTGFNEGATSVTNPTLGQSSTWKFNAITCSQNIIFTVLKWTEASPSTIVHSYIFKSTDKGATWTKLGSDLLGVTVNSIEVVGQTIYICGSAGTFKKSIDGGETWTSKDLSAYGSINDIRVVDANTFYLSAGTGNGVLKSTDAGENITPLLNSKPSFDVLYLSDLNIIFSVGLSANIKRSIDSGNTWSSAIIGLGSANSFDLTYFNNTIYIMGGDKKIYTLSPDQLLDPTADFTVKYNDLDVEFTNASKNSGSYTWDFDPINNPGTTTSTLVNPSYTYSILGTYKAKLTAGNAVSQISVTKDITIAQSADYSYLVGGARQVKFTNLSQNYPGYTWDFGDGTTTSTDKNPVHTYTSYGAFTVKMTAGASIIDVIKDINVPQPVAGFSAVLENGNKVTFTNLSQNASTYIWDFGDGTATSTETNPIHTYTSVGTFDVKLIASDGATSPDFTAQVTTKKPTPLFSFIVGAAKTVTFTNLTEDGISYIWDFGDGTASSTETNPVHAFSSFNSYNVKLTATNDLGSNEVIKSVDVLEAIANFTFVIEGGDKVVFTNTSINCNTYSWDFGDGTALSIESNPTHTFTSLGDFNVKLVAGDGVNESYVTKLITIAQPVADFSFAITNGNLLTFTNLSQNCATYSWDFGDGTALSTDVNPVHSYTTYGKFNVKLFAGNSIGQVNITKEVTISQPTVDFTYAADATLPNKITFTNTSTNCKAYSWDFKTGTILAETSPSFIFPQLGSFEVTLNGYDGIDTVSTPKTIVIDTIAAQWSYMLTDSSKILQKLYPFNNDTAIILGNSTTILRTTDGGLTWPSAIFPVENECFNPNDILFFDKENGFATFSVSGTKNGFMLKTTDNGQTWSQVALSVFSDGTGDATMDPAASTATKVYFYSMTKTSSTTGFVVLRWQDAASAFHGYVYKTIDSGSTWAKVSADIYQANTYTSVINTIGFDATGLTGYIGGVSLLLKTIDGGSTWTKISYTAISGAKAATNFGSINDMIIKDANTVYLATQNGTLKTTDGFTKGSIIEPGYSWDILAINDTTYLTGGNPNNLLKISRDNGATWVASDKGIGSFFELAIFNNKLYALTSNGKAYFSLLDFYNIPKLDFSYTRADKVVTFTNLSTNTKSYAWTFGDTQSSVEVSPVHTYADYGTFSVTLNGGNLCWKGDAKTVVISIVTGIDTKELSGFQIWPNPATDGYVNFNLGDAFNNATTLYITDIQGRLVYTQTLGSSRTISIGLNPGMYLVKVVSNNASATQKLIVK